MVGAKVFKPADENEASSSKQVTKLGCSTTAEAAVRTALGGLQNVGVGVGVVRGGVVSGKNAAAPKDPKESDLQKICINSTWKTVTPMSSGRFLAQQKDAMALTPKLHRQQNCIKALSEIRATTYQHQHHNVPMPSSAPAASSSKGATKIKTKSDLYLVAEYVDDIYSHLFEQEVLRPIQKNHLATKITISPDKRSILMNWIVKVHYRLHFLVDTLHLAVAIIDHYLQSLKDTDEINMQLVGVTAVMLAAKYEELCIPYMKDCSNFVGDLYKQIPAMEIKMMMALGFYLSYPLPIHFLRRFSKVGNAGPACHTMSKYFLELATIEYDFAHYLPSEMAAASLFLSLNLTNEDRNIAAGLNDKHWKTCLVYYSRYSAHHLRPIAEKLARVARNAATSKLKAVFTKFKSRNFQQTSLRSELASPLMDSICGAL